MAGWDGDIRAVDSVLSIPKIEVTNTDLPLKLHNRVKDWIYTKDLITVTGLIANLFDVQGDTAQKTLDALKRSWDLSPDDFIRLPPDSRISALERTLDLDVSTARFVSCNIGIWMKENSLTFSAHTLLRMTTQNKPIIALFDQQRLSFFLQPELWAPNPLPIAQICAYGSDAISEDMRRKLKNILNVLASEGNNEAKRYVDILNKTKAEAFVKVPALSPEEEVRLAIEKALDANNPDIRPVQNLFAADFDAADSIIENLLSAVNAAVGGMRPAVDVMIEFMNQAKYGDLEIPSEQPSFLARLFGSKAKENPLSLSDRYTLVKQAVAQGVEPANEAIALMHQLGMTQKGAIDRLNAGVDAIEIALDREEISNSDTLSVELASRRNAIGSKINNTNFLAGTVGTMHRQLAEMRNSYAGLKDASQIAQVVQTAESMTNADFFTRVMQQQAKDMLAIIGGTLHSVRAHYTINGGNGQHAGQMLEDLSGLQKTLANVVEKSEPVAQRPKTPGG